jgi:hypothetical protein
MHYRCCISLQVLFLCIIYALSLLHIFAGALSMHYRCSFYALSLLHIYALSVLFFCDPMAMVHGWRPDGCSQGALSQSVALASLNCRR